MPVRNPTLVRHTSKPTVFCISAKHDSMAARYRRPANPAYGADQIVAADLGQELAGPKPAASIGLD
jgi:hypothetical protein